MTKRVCLVSTGQPSTNPRLVKEADALVAAGYEVRVIGAHWADWADETDAELIGRRGWSCHVLDWRRHTAPWVFWKSRVRYAAARAASHTSMGRRLFTGAAAGRLTPELSAAAIAWPADLYIGHNLGALPAAAAAAERHAARLGFDAEDFHGGQAPIADAQAAALTRAVEDRFLPRCDYVTAASPEIAAAYRSRCRRAPVVVLNVFPAGDRPARPEAPSSDRLRLYWFSQTIGRDRGLETAIAAMGRVSSPVELHLRGAWQSGYERHLRHCALTAGVNAALVVQHAPAPPGEMVRLAATYSAGLALEPGGTANSRMALSNKIFTYLLAGIPVVASATPAQSALVRDLGLAGVCVPPGDVEALARVLQSWHDNPGALTAARHAAWQMGSTRYNWEVEQDAFLDAVRSVLQDRPAGVTALSGLAS